MACKTCTTREGLEVCLFCGHSFCSNHRVDSGGVLTCTSCLEAEHARKQATAHKPAFTPPAERERASAALGEVKVVAEEPLAPLREPKGKKPVLLGLAAGVPTALYLYWFLGWLSSQQELPGWVQQAGTGAGALVAFAGVWAIMKSRQS